MDHSWYLTRSVSTSSVGAVSCQSDNSNSSPNCDLRQNPSQQMHINNIKVVIVDTHMPVMGGLEKHTWDKNERLINKLSVLLAVSSSLSFRNAQMRVLRCFYNSTKYFAWITWFHAPRNRWHYSYSLTNLKQESQKLESSVHFLMK
jgi:hypothetical protein